MTFQEYNVEKDFGDLKDRKHHYDATMTSVCNLTLFHMDGGGGADSTCLKIVFFITSFRGAAEPQDLVTFQEYNVE